VTESSGHFVDSLKTFSVQVNTEYSDIMQQEVLYVKVAGNHESLWSNFIQE
jgi:hypothetical protein